MEGVLKGCLLKRVYYRVPTTVCVCVLKGVSFPTWYVPALGVPAALLQVAGKYVAVLSALGVAALQVA